MRLNRILFVVCIIMIPISIAAKEYISAVTFMINAFNAVLLEGV